MNSACIICLPRAAWGRESRQWATWEGEFRLPAGAEAQAHRITALPGVTDAALAGM